MHHETKSCRAEVKAFDAITGVAEAVVSVFGNIDLGGDRVVEGAFSKTLAEWGTKGTPIPVIWSHEWDDPKSHIGWVEDAAERPDLGGLWVKMRFDIEANDRAAYVARLLKQRRVTQFSFGYYARDYRMVQEADGTVVRELTDIDLFEVGPTLLGMNPATQLLEAASAFSKGDLVLNRKAQRSLAKARDILDSILNPAVEDAEAASTEPDEKSGLPEVKVAAPGWMRENAKQGLAWYEEGLAGDGVVDATIREARDIAGGTVTDAKARKMRAWFARHMVDLDAPAADPGHDDYPSPGVVAHALWGGGAKSDSERAYAWAERRVAELDGEKSVDTAPTLDETEDDTDSRDATDRLVDKSEWLRLLARTRHQETESQ